MKIKHMTSKHFIALAKILNRNLFQLNGKTDSKLIHDIADFLEITNPLFDREKFITASRIDE
jgi:hypothetical protein|tara:strand:+ start:354 stop:539 length:186 start_codon:yes stop_codon:yes gene_type:complete